MKKKEGKDKKVKSFVNKSEKMIRKGKKSEEQIEEDQNKNENSADNS